MIMELNINSPVYFKDRYGIDDEVYKFCQRAYLFFKDKKYSNTLQIIGIVPIVAPQEIVEGKNYKEKVKFLCNKSVASINIKMDFNDYYDTYRKAVERTYSNTEITKDQAETEGESNG